MDSAFRIMRFLEIEKPEYESRSPEKRFSATTCIQTAGDVVVVPEGWGHGIINIQVCHILLCKIRTYMHPRNVYIRVVFVGICGHRY